MDEGAEFYEEFLEQSEEVLNELKQIKDALIFLKSSLSSVKIVGWDNLLKQNKEIYQKLKEIQNSDLQVKDLEVLIQKNEEIIKNLLSLKEIARDSALISQEEASSIVQNLKTLETSIRKNLSNVSSLIQKILEFLKNNEKEKIDLKPLNNIVSLLSQINERLNNIKIPEFKLPEIKNLNLPQIESQLESIKNLLKQLISNFEKFNYRQELENLVKAIKDIDITVSGWGYPLEFVDTIDTQKKAIRIYAVGGSVGGGGGMGGTISVGQIAFGVDENVIGGSESLKWNETSQTLLTPALKIGNLSGILKASDGYILGEATTSDLPEGTNLYYTDTRARNAISANSPITYNPSTGVIGLNTPLSVSYGGTGLSNLGSSNQLLGVNSTANALEYKNITSLLNAGAGISISGTTIATISNTGVLSLNNLTGSLTLQGTANQINVSSQNSTITLSTPQNIAPSSSPTFSGLTLSSLAAGSVLFAGSGGLISQDNSNLYWDNTNKRLGICTATPQYTLHVMGDLAVSGCTIFNGVMYQWPNDAGTDGQVLTTNGYGQLRWSTPSVEIIENLRKGMIGIVIGDGVNEITPGFKGAVLIPFNADMVRWTVMSIDDNPPTLGDIVIDVLITNVSYYPDFVSAVGSGEKPFLNSDYFNGLNASDIPNNWDISTLSSGDIIGFNVVSASNLKKVILIIEVFKHLYG